MKWSFTIHAQQERRLFSRILQILETQLVTVCSFHGETDSVQSRVLFVVQSEQDKAYRIEALLYKLQGIDYVCVLTDAESRTLPCSC